MMPAINGVMLAVSSSLAVSIVAKATVTTAMSLVGVRLARRSRAAVRHALLAAAFGVLLALPLASIVVPPVRIAVPVVAQERSVLVFAGDPAPWNPQRRRMQTPISRRQVRNRQDFRCLLYCSWGGSAGRHFF
jgi:hypothetical protein